MSRETTTVEPDQRRASCRGVNGLGPRCGCGEPSAVHVQYNREPDRDYFLCEACVLDAAELYLHYRRQADQLRPTSDITDREMRREHGWGYHELVTERWCPLCEEAHRASE